MSIKIASMNFGDCDTILHNTPNGMKNIAEVLGPNGEVYWSATKELTGIPPLSIRSNGTMLLDYLISGNMSQTGTPTPDNPIQPQETGERTGNLWSNRGFSATTITLNNTHNISNNYGTTLSTTEGDEVTITQSEYPTGNVGYQNGFFMIDVDFSKYAVGDVVTISFDYIVNEVHALSTQTATTIYAGKNSNTVPPTLSSGDWKISGRLTAVITIIADMNPYVEVRLCGNSITVKNIMLNLGSTALPYEPYGIKIPISSGGVNLFDKTKATLNAVVTSDVGERPYTGFAVSDYIAVSEGAYYLTNVVGFRRQVTLSTFDATKTFTGTLSISGGEISSETVTIDNNTKYIRINMSMTDNNIDSVMVNRGSTALPYEPYVQPTLSNIYLGAVQTTRKIKKIVLDGTETWNKELGVMFFITSVSMPLTSYGESFCSHYTSQPSYDDVRANNFTFGVSRRPALFIHDERFTTTDELQAYLQQQYSAGTPVCVWYILATPTTGIVNEPLRKIGDYADTVSMEQAGVQIPTNRGNTVIDVETTLKPSQMYIKYK